MDLKFYVAYIKTLLTKFRYLILLASVAGAVIFIIAKFIFPQVFPQTTITGIVGQYPIDNLPTHVSQKISLSLVSINDNGDLVPQLATSWESSNESQTWVFHLPPNINSTKIPLTIKGAKISYPGPDSIQFELLQSYVSFPYLLTKPIIGKNADIYGGNKIISFKTRRDLVTRLVVEYKNRTRERFIFYPTNEAAFTAMKLGQIDRLQNVRETGGLDEAKNIAMQKVQNDTEIVLLFFNTTSDFFSSKEARVALNYALDKNSFGQKRAYSTIYAKGPFYNSLVKKYDYDLVKAKSLVADNKLRAEKPLRIVATPDLVNVAEKVKSDWEQTGIPCEVFVTTIKPTEFDAYITTFAIPYDPDQYPLWHSTQKETNIARYNNPRIDKLLEDGRVAQDLENRKKIYFDFQRFLAEDSPVIPLYFSQYYNLERI